MRRIEMSRKIALNALMLLIGLGFSAGGAFAQTGSWIEANVTGDWIDVFDFPPLSEVTISAYEFQGDEFAKCEAMPTTDESGYAKLTCWDVGLEPGNFVVASDGVVTKELELVHLTIDIFDPDGDFISGTAPGGAQVRVDVYNPPPVDTFWSLTEAAEVDGYWEAYFSPFDITPEAGYWAYVGDDDGDFTMAELSPPPPLPFIIAWPEWDWVEGIGWPEGAVVQLIIDDDEDPFNPPLYSTTAESVTNPWNPDETLVGFNLNDVVDLIAGHAVVMIYEDTVKVHFVTGLEVGAIDPLADTVSGTAEPYSGVDLWVHRTPGTDIWAEADGDGSWTADFSAVYDVEPGTGGIAAQFDEDGDGTFVEWFLVTPGWVVEEIERLVDEGQIAPVLKNSLTAKIESALKSKGKGDFTPAIRKLHAFINELEAQRGHKISEEAADQLIRYALDLIAEVEG
jgi:hypothetical protein